MRKSRRNSIIILWSRETQYTSGAKFNQRVQGEDEAVESFITALYCLVEYCEYGTLRDEMIRDRLVVGLRDAKLSERLQRKTKRIVARTTSVGSGYERTGRSEDTSTTILVVETEAGTSLRRNRRDLIPITHTTASEVNPPETSTSTSRRPVDPPTSPRPVTVTRSGRHVRPPVKLNL